MGAVYLAEDTSLGRRIALKVLPAEVSSDAGRLARFEREAKAVAALNHPHIVTIHSVEESEGTRFLTMELIEGTSLDHALPPGGLPLAKVFDIGIALADALAAAHEKGIVHRDLKPANIMVTKDGRVKVLDFGLAKLSLPGAGGTPAPGPAGTEGARLSAIATGEPSPGRPLTDAGMAIGTVPYMSPEQVGGEAVDARTDLFSLGVVLYELATGRRPFEGKNKAEAISSILRDVPRPVSETRPDAPRHLSRIIDHCLQKEPRDRFQTARDVFNELRALSKEVESGLSPAGAAFATAAASGTTRRAPAGRRGLWIGLAVVGVAALAGVLLFRRVGREAPPSSGSPAAPATAATPAESPAAGPDPHSIAVLPFVDMSQARDQEYFSDGIAEELLNLLARIPELKVAARTSSFSFKGQEIGIPEIARQLHVGHVLEGSVRKSGDRVRVTAQLIHAADGFHVWSETYDRRLDDIFRIQEEIAADVVKELQVTLLGAGPKARTTDPKAYALFLQAKQLARLHTAEAFSRADALYRQVLAIDPRYTPAWNELGRNFVNEANIGMLPSEEGYARARDAAEKALAIDPDNAPAHAGLGWIAMTVDNDLAGAARHFERALELDPRDLSILGNVATFLHYLGRQDEALALMETIVRRDPVNVTTLSNLGYIQRLAGRYDEAIASHRTVLRLSPQRGGTRYLIALSLLMRGDASAALAECEQETTEMWRLIGLPMAYHALGRKADADTALAALIAKFAKDSPSNIASVYAYSGQADEAFAWLDKAVEYKDGGLSEIPAENLFTNIHSDPRWLPFLRRIGRAPEQLAEIRFKVAIPDRGPRAIRSFRTGRAARLLAGTRRPFPSTSCAGRRRGQAPWPWCDARPRAVLLARERARARAHARATGAPERRRDHHYG
jgi:TolB-like protein